MLLRQKRVNKIESIIAGLPKDTTQIKVSYSLRNKPNELEKIGFASTDPNNGETLLPNVVGPVSRFNAHGKYIVRKDLPKESRVIYERLWRWSEWSGNGQKIEREEIRDVPRDCYPRDFIEPLCKEFTYDQDRIVSDLLEIKKLDEFKHTINLFLEFFGECELMNNDLSTLPETTTIRRVNWKIFPEGDNLWDRIEKYLNSCGVKNTDTGVPIIERQKLLYSYNPKEIVMGTAGFRGYLAYVFDKIIILESVKYGNAIYAFEKNWEEFSKLTKAEIISAKLHKERIVHSKGWKNRVENLIK